MENNYSMMRNCHNHSIQTRDCHNHSMQTRDCHNHSMQTHDCEHKHEQFYNDFPIGMGYVPWQKWRNIYEPDKAFMRGTIFAELDKPFLGSGMRGGKK